jgi:hypothetical protein
MSELVVSLDLESYARLAAALVAPGVDRDAVLASHGLDEDSWEAIEQDWLERLSEADDAAGDGEVPPLVAAYAEAFARAQAEQAGEVLTFERYLEITRALSRGRDMAQLLDRFGIDLPTYLHSHRIWTVRMASDRELAERLRRAMR